MNIGNKIVDIPTRYIWFDSIKEGFGDRQEFVKFLQDKTYLQVGSKNSKDFYTDIYNSHHFTTKYIYEHAEEILNYIGLPFNINDFDLVSNIEGDEDFSFLVSKKDYDYETYYDRYHVGENGICYVWEMEKLGTFKINDLTNVKVENDAEFFKMHCTFTSYHRLYRFAHQNSYIKNLNMENGIKLLISCDSFMIPLIPLILPYCEELTIMDNRLRDYRYNAFKEREYTRVIYCLSTGNNLNKYLELNL